MIAPELRVLIAILVLLYSSAQDLKHRKIDDLAWKILAASGVVFAIYELISIGVIPLDLAVSVLMMSIILVPLERLGRMGRGDVKILIGLATVLPTNPYFRISVFPVFSISVLTNAVFMTTAVTIYFLGRNLFRRDIAVKNLGEARFLFLGYKKRASEITEHEKIMKRVGDEAWVTPALPFIVPITLGFALSIVWGDIASYIVLRL